MTRGPAYNPTPIKFSPFSAEEVAILKETSYACPDCLAGWSRDTEQRLEVKKTEMDPHTHGLLCPLCACNQQWCYEEDLADAPTPQETGDGDG